MRNLSSKVPSVFTIPNMRAFFMPGRLGTAADNRPGPEPAPAKASPLAFKKYLRLKRGSEVIIVVLGMEQRMTNDEARMAKETRNPNDFGHSLGLRLVHS